MTKWPMVKLGQVLQLQRRWIKLNPTETYREIGIRSFGNGIFHKAPIAGIALGNKRVLRIEPGDLVFNNVFAWEGAVAVAGPEEAGMIGSHRFITYSVDPTNSTAEFVKLFFATPGGLELLMKASPGSAGRNKTLGLDRFISQSIPLPPLAEQRRVVARIEELATQVHEARTLRQQTADEAELLMTAASSDCFLSLAKSHRGYPVGKTFVFRNDLVRPTDGSSGAIRFIGLQHIESNTGRKIGEDHLRAEELTGRKFKFSPGEIVYGYLRPYLNKVWIADCEGVCSVDQYVLRPIASVSDTNYLAYFLRSGFFLKQAIELTHNLMLPRLRSGLLRGIRIPTPPLAEQRRIVAELDALQAEVDAMKRLQAETAAELDALLPAILDRAFKGEL